MLWVLVFVGLAGCSSDEATGLRTTNPGEFSIVLSELDRTMIEEGEVLYQANCAACHGADLSGTPDWKTRNEDGSYPPPPHDSTGHTWHHPDSLFVDIVANGSDFEQSRMPAFGEQLTEADILSILEFLKSNWGDRERAFQAEVTANDEAAQP